MTETKKISGFVQRIASSGEGDKKRYGAMLEGQVWYNGWGDKPDCCQEGFEVEIEYTDVTRDGRTFHNIKSVKALEHMDDNQTEIPKAPTTKQTITQKDETIARSVAIKAIAEICPKYDAPNQDTIKNIISLAKPITRYILFGEK